jgi:addiction module HigA family antidote
MINRYVPDYLVTPGEVLKDYLEFMGFTPVSLAKKAGLSEETINEIIETKSAITAEIALKFEHALDRPAHFWIGLEQQYYEDRVQQIGKRYSTEKIND